MSDLPNLRATPSTLKCYAGDNRWDSCSALAAGDDFLLYDWRVHPSPAGHCQLGCPDPIRVEAGLSFPPAASSGRSRYNLFQCPAGGRRGFPALLLVMRLARANWLKSIHPGLSFRGDASSKGRECPFGGKGKSHSQLLMRTSIRAINAPCSDG